MAEKNQTTYWKELFPLWKKEFQLWFGTETWGQFVTKLIGNIVPIVVIFVIGGNAEKFVDEVVARMATWLVLAIWAVFILTINFIRANFNLFNKQKEIQENQNRKINKFQGLMKSKTIKTKKIRFKAEEEYAKDILKEHYAYLEVLNGEDNDLLDCFATLEVLKIKYSDEEEWGDCLGSTYRNNNFLTWPNFNTAKDEKKVRRGKPERINIAKMKVNGFPVFMFADGAEETMPAPQIYIEVSLNGTLKGKPIDEITFCGFVKYENSFYVQEGANITTIKNGITTKTTEPSQKIPSWRVYIIPGELPDNQTNETKQRNKNPVT